MKFHIYLLEALSVPPSYWRLCLILEALIWLNILMRSAMNNKQRLDAFTLAPEGATPPALHNQRAYLFKSYFKFIMLATLSCILGPITHLRQWLQF